MSQTIARDPCSANEPSCAVPPALIECLPAANGCVVQRPVCDPLKALRLSAREPQVPPGYEHQPRWELTYHLETRGPFWAKCVSDDARRRTKALARIESWPRPPEAAAKLEGFVYEHLYLASDVDDAALLQAAHEAILLGASLLAGVRPRVSVDCLTSLRTVLSKGSVTANVKDRDYRRTIQIIERHLARREHRNRSSEGQDLLTNLRQILPNRWRRLSEQDCRQALLRWTEGRPRTGQLSTIGLAVNLALRCGAFEVKCAEGTKDYDEERRSLYRRFHQAWTKRDSAKNKG